MRSGLVLEWVFQDDEAAKGFARVMRGAFDLPGGKPGAGRLKTLLRRTDTTFESITLKPRVVRLDLVINDNVVGYLAEDGFADADERVIDGLHALARKQGGEPLTPGHFRREENAARLAELEAEGRRVLSILEAPLDTYPNFGERGKWMARMFDPPPDRIRGRWSVATAGDPRSFEGTLDRGVLALRTVPGEPPRWRSGDVVELVEEVRPAQAPTGLFARLRALVARA